MTSGSMIAAVRGQYPLAALTGARTDVCLSEQEGLLRGRACAPAAPLWEP